MNQQEQDAIKRLETEIGRLSSAHEALKTESAAKDVTIADLTAKLAAASVPADTSDVVDAVNALSDKVDAELSPPAPTVDPALAAG